MSKKRRINIAPATMLRPRMDHLWADDALLDKDEAAIRDDLDVLARDVSPELFVKTMLLAYQAASEEAQAKLKEIVPRWLAQSGYIDTLEEMTATQAFKPDSRPLALTWLEAAGRDVADLESLPSLFFDARHHEDKSQAYIDVYWYTNFQKNRASGLGFLIDYNPPWDGSVKDVIVMPKRSPRALLKYVDSTWSHGGMRLENVSPEQAKTVILTALGCNRTAEIRLPFDMIHTRDLFERCVLSLPDGPDTPTFTMEDFDFLARHGERPAKIMQFERTVGRRVRMDDGQELLIMGGPDDLDDEW